MNNATNSIDNCHLSLCNSFDEIILSRKVNDEKHIDVTTLLISKIDIEKKQIVYKHKFSRPDIIVLIDFNRNGYVDFAQISSINEDYDFELCFSDIDDSIFDARDKMYMEISEHISCILKDCNFFSERM